MGNYEQLKQAVSDVIKTNGNQEITGAIMQNALLTIISTVGDNATFAGIATPTTNPGTPDQNVFYIASKPGVYSNFGGVELTDQVFIFTNKNGNWVKQDYGIATSAKVSELENYVNTLYINISQLYPTDGYTNEGASGGNQYSIDEAIQLLRDKGMDSVLKTLQGIIFVNKESKKWELWIYTKYTKDGNNYYRSYNFERVLSYSAYTALLNEINAPRHTFEKTNVLNVQSLNLIEKLEYKTFDVVTGAFGDEGSSTVPLVVLNMVGIKTTDIYFYNHQGKFNPNLNKVYCFDEYGNFIRNGGFQFDSTTSDANVRHFIIPANVSKLVAQYISIESAFTQRLENYLPYGVTEREFNIRNSNFYLLGKTLDSVSIDISHMFSTLKKEIFLKAGSTYKITSDYSSTYSYIDVKGNFVPITLGEKITPKYDVYYILGAFINTQNRKAYINIEYIPDEVTIDGIKGLKNLKVGKLPFTMRVNLQKGTINPKNGDVTYSEDGTEYISEYVPIIPTPMIYVTGYIIAICFYDINKNFISNGTVIQRSIAYKSPEGAYYMVCSRPNASAIDFGYVSTEEEFKVLGQNTIINLCRGDKTRLSVPNTRLRNKTVYVVGDSEAARFRSALSPLDSLQYCASSSFGGHSDDMISSNVGLVTTGGDLQMTSLKNAKVIVQSSTNGADIPRLRAYILELIRAIRNYGASEIWGMSLCAGVNTTFEELQNNGKYRMQKILFGGHFVDHMAAVYQMGLYYNMYHPKAFIQPEVGGNVDIYFDDVKPFIDFTNNPIFGVGLEFYMQYYDEKYDIYTVVSIDKENNKITATLKTNSSDILPGATAGQYEEKVSTSVWSGRKSTKGFIYNEADKTNVEQGKLPYNIYQDHTVHYGLILSAIIKDMLYATGALEYEDEFAVSYLNKSVE